MNRSFWMYLLQHSQDHVPDTYGLQPFFIALLGDESSGIIDSESLEDVEHQ